MSELTAMGIPLSKIDREKGIPVVAIPDLYCPECSRKLRVLLDDLRYGKIFVEGCGECSPARWYGMRIDEIQIAQGFTK